MTARHIVLGGLAALALVACSNEPPAATPAAETPRIEPKTQDNAQAEGAAETPRRGLAAAVADEVAEARLAEQPPREAKAEAPPKQRPKPGELRQPTAEEFAAWDRLAPGPKVSTWDEEHTDLLVASFEHLHCAREEMRVAGQAYLDGGDDMAWLDSKRRLVLTLDRWQSNLFATQPRIAETSKLLGTLLEAHELVSFSYPRAYNSGSAEDLAKADARWTLLDDKATAALASAGATLSAPTPAECSAAKAKEAE